MKDKPKCSCYGGFDCPACNPDYYEEQTTTDTNEVSLTPRTDACPYCGAEISIPHKGGKPRFYKCQSRIGGSQTRPAYCREREKSQKLEAKNVCLQELIQEFYEWSRRDFPTEQEVREIMNRYYDLLNK